MVIMIYYIDAANPFSRQGPSGIPCTCFSCLEEGLSMTNIVLPATERFVKDYLKMIIYELGIIDMGVQ
ncbi:hypothetical protein [Methanolobus chelungpuianus]|uniref:hypothetical protein n=1 Tax=Methanolobus chelungpuianus TaxID=502115 RepID=UPI002115619B|nr:hypothetical protein [Methanolobus chelungpuianus]